jgi:putative tryptophan/tyrosine transport system substrate-binding protein
MNIMIGRGHTVGLIVTLALSILVVPLAADARQARKVPKIGVLLLGSPPSAPDWKQRSLFLQELRTLGWTEGQNMMVEYRWAHGRFERLDDLAVELVRLNVDVIVVSDSLAIQAVKQATPTIPIVMLYVGDPVADGVVASLARPGGNVTGVGGLVPNLSGKLLELLQEAVPNVTRIAVLVNPGNPMTESILRDVERVAQVLSIQLHVLAVWHAQALKHAFDTALREGTGALLVPPALLFTLNQRRIAALAVQSRLPAIYWQRPFAEAGGLMAYGPRISDLWLRVAALVDKILRGTKPVDLPVEQPLRFELVINLKTAKALGMTMPPSLLLLADEVIQ